MTWRDVIEVAVAAPIGFAVGWRYARWRRRRKGGDKTDATS